MIEFLRQRSWLAIGLAGALALGLGMLLARAAVAAGIGPFNSQQMGVASGTIGPCNASDIVLDQVSTGYSNTPTPRYEIRSIRFATVPAGCVGENFQLAVLDNNATKTNLGGLNGVVPAAGNRVNFPIGSGPDVAAINFTNNQVVLSLAVYG